MAEPCEPSTSQSKAEQREHSAKPCLLERHCCCTAARTVLYCDLESFVHGFQHLTLTPHNAKANSTFRLMSTFPFIATAKCEDYINLHLLCASNAFQIIVVTPQRYRREFPGSVCWMEKTAGIQEKETALCVFITPPGSGAEERGSKAGLCTLLRMRGLSNKAPITMGRGTAALRSL